LIRDEIKLDDQAAKGKVIDIPAAKGQTNRIGVIDLPSFYVPMDLNGPRKSDGEKSTPHYTSTDVAKLLAKFNKEHVQGVILDLRRNGGGSLEECVKLTGLFIKDGPVVQVKDAANRIFVDEDRDSRLQYDGPLIVLTSRYSASASEILAGALQDYDRALIVGDLSTHGKGTVQQLQPLRQFITEEAMTNDPGTLKITKAKFYRASGGSTQLNGVYSDIVLPSILNHAKDIGEKAIESALPYDKIESARFDKLNDVSPYKQELLNRSSARIDKDRDYDYVRQDIETFRKHQALNSISLNEKARIKEWDDEDLRQRARNKERLTRKTPDRVTYDVSLAQAELPGLVVTVKTNAPTTHVTITDGKSSPKSPVTHETAEAGEDAVPAIDPALEETQRILLDYIGMLARKGVAATTR
jgi:carboxyl-terminal processing protease